MDRDITTEMVNNIELSGYIVPVIAVLYFMETVHLRL